jgi:hypothetical protein
VNNFVLQHKMDKVKVECDSISDIPPPFLSSEHEFHDMNDEGPVSFDILQKGQKVRHFLYSVNHVIFDLT